MWSKQWVFTSSFANKSIRIQSTISLLLLFFFKQNLKQWPIKSISKRKDSLLIIYIKTFVVKSLTVIVDIFSYYLSPNFSGYPSKNFGFEISFGKYSFTIFRTSRLSLCFEDNHRQEFGGWGGKEEMHLWLHPQEVREKGKQSKVPPSYIYTEAT